MNNASMMFRAYVRARTAVKQIEGCWEWNRREPTRMTLARVQTICAELEAALAWAEQIDFEGGRPTAAHTVSRGKHKRSTGAPTSGRPLKRTKP